MNNYAPCPQCGGANAQPVKFTWWGGVLGPKLLHHVKCVQCSAQYNGKTGQSNTRGIVIYSVVAGVIALFFIGFIFFGLVLMAALNR
jgi:hypothetical protein